MNITIHEELRSFVDPLTPTEYAALERSLLAEGCRDALVLWNDILIDGHNRYDICTKHGIEFKTVQNTRFTSIEEVMLWMIDNHLARRSVSDYQRGVLALRKKELITSRAAPPPPAAPPADTTDGSTPPWEGENEIPKPVIKKEELAREARVSSATISQIERIRKDASPELVQAVRQGAISINAAANVAALPKEVQAAAVAGGKKELQQLAKQVREQKLATRAPREPKAPPADVPDGPPTRGSDNELITLRAQVAVLRQKVIDLTVENTELKEQLAAKN
ncbi:hypothetical protein E4L96_07995 [Massilia arenosa]|uniref:Plasmid replication/partition related protein n=1 Tax=Zemynaea arenosa TaxID=2561931 RepID=A0A4Y9SFL8_9BURK|nr:hypothetical protein [Massilia arenosa]TFW22458.1 hypothetical protein E4L96_07995 [Massilia arenosa]